MLFCLVLGLLVGVAGGELVRQFDPRGFVRDYLRRPW